MIQSIYIKNYKIIKEQTLTLSNLNILTGLNSSGKSSFIQSLLLLRQSYDRGYLSRRQPLLYLGEEGNEYMTRTGFFSDIFNFYAERTESIVFDIVENENSYKLTTIPYDNIPETAIPCTLTTNSDWEQSVLFSNRFQYLSTDRIIPQESYPKFVTGELLGKDGRYTAHYLDRHGRTPIAIESLWHPAALSNFLIEQVACWMGEISPGVIVETEEKAQNIELRYAYRQNNFSIKPQNVGFGLTYALPIVVALLSAKPGDLLLLENPETHLHPKGQSKLARLMALTAQAGVQIICETHSDHIINGTLVACKEMEKGQQGIDRNNVHIFYIDKNDDTPENNVVIPIPILEGGRITYAPTDFFSQIKNDQKILMGF